ncbi:ester cyclase [Pseudonocardia sp.]|uniref:ester cyclase n=1 Tax=Pseudonocardia sp. TaxID=60912 RepID=UPI003D0DBCC3
MCRAGHRATIAATEARHLPLRRPDRLPVHLVGHARRRVHGVPATGNPVALSGITILRMRDGVCVERWSSTDMLGLLVQIGAMPVPAQNL